MVAFKDTSRTRSEFECLVTLLSNVGSVRFTPAARLPPSYHSRESHEDTLVEVLEDPETPTLPRFELDASHDISY
jgi:hypothetical protein